MERLAHPGWCANLVVASSLRTGERVLVVVDEPLVEQGSQLTAAVRDAGGEPRLELWAGPRRPLTSAPRAALAGARDADVAFFLAHSPLGDEAAARFELGAAVSGHGGRMIFMGFIDGPLLEGKLSEPPPNLESVARRLGDELAGVSTVRITGGAGTDLTLRVEGRPWLTDSKPLEAGEMANFPNGEIFVAPHADGADGVLVADLSVPYTVPGLVDEPVRMEFERGRVTSITGGRAAELLRELVERAGAGADVIAELGIGFNPTFTPIGHVLLDEKAAGTAHVAIGRNTGTYGGDNEAKIHVDCVFSAPTLKADGRSVELP
jgi:hypothetical protein